MLDTCKRRRCIQSIRCHPIGCPYPVVGPGAGGRRPAASAESRCTRGILSGFATSLDAPGQSTRWPRGPDALGGRRRASGRRLRHRPDVCTHGADAGVEPARAHGHAPPTTWRMWPAPRRTVSCPRRARPKRPCGERRNAAVSVRQRAHLGAGCNRWISGQGGPRRPASRDAPPDVGKCCTGAGFTPCLATDRAGTGVSVPVCAPAWACRQRRDGALVPAFAAGPPLPRHQAAAGMSTPGGGVPQQGA
jgi:hypothetical protein